MDGQNILKGIAGNIRRTFRRVRELVHNVTNGAPEHTFLFVPLFTHFGVVHFAHCGFRQFESDVIGHFKVAEIKSVIRPFRLGRIFSPVRPQFFVRHRNQIEMIHVGHFRDGLECFQVSGIVVNEIGELVEQIDNSAQMVFLANSGNPSVKCFDIHAQINVVPAKNSLHVLQIMGWHHGFRFRSRGRLLQQQRNQFFHRPDIGSKIGHFSQHGIAGFKKARPLAL